MNDILQKFKNRLRNKLRFLAGKLKRYPILDLSSEDLDPLAAIARAKRDPILISVRLDQCRWSGATGFSYGPRSRHPYVRTLTQYRKTGKPTVNQSYLYKFYAAFQPRSLAEFQGLGPDGHTLLSLLPPLNIYPWSPISIEQLHALAANESDALPSSFCIVRSCGPKPADFTQARIDRLFELFDLITEEGFRMASRPDLTYFNQFPVGDVMVRGSETRLILANGQHRAAVMSALEYDTIRVLVGVKHSRGPFLIARTEVDTWPLVSAGIYRKDQALQIFDNIFDGNGPGPRSVEVA